MCQVVVARVDSRWRELLEKLSSLGLQRLACIGVCLVMLASGARADETGWRIISPIDGTRFQRLITGLVVSIEKPSNETGNLKFTFWNQGLGESREFPVGLKSTEHVAISLGGSTLPDGEYRIQIFSGRDPSRIMAEVSIVVETDPARKPNLPTIDFPLPETRFPLNTASMTFAGLAGGQVWGIVRRDGQDLMSFHCQQRVGLFWAHSVPWGFGAGQYEVTVYDGDPQTFLLKPEASTSFIIGEELPATDSDERPDQPMLPRMGTGRGAPFTTAPEPWTGKVPATAWDNQ